MNHCRFGCHLLAGKLTGKRYPLQVNLHVTDNCNLRCRYCYIDFEHAHPNMPLDALKKIIGEARQCGTERISLEGGEPLIRKDIGAIVDAICDLGMECNINTNGYLLPERIDAISRADIISVSLDGPKDVHDHFRGKGSYDKAIEAIRLARDHGIRVTVLSVLTKANRGYVDFMIKLAREMGFAWIPTSLFFMAGATIDERSASRYKIEDDEYRQLIQELIDKKAEGAPIVWSRKTLEYVKNWPATYFQSNFFEGDERMMAARFKPLKCQAARYFCVMQTNGDLYSCDPLLGYGKPANAVELGFKEAFKRTTTNRCVACNSFVCSEYHSLFGMNLGVILNLLASYRK